MVWLIPEGKLTPFITLILMWIITLISIYYGKKGKFSVRRIPGLDKIEEAVGRAVEMGRPIFDIIGMGSFTSIYAPQTVAGLSVLGYVSKLCAEKGAKLIAPQAAVDVMPVAVEIVRQSYAEAGKLDELDVDEQLPYLSGTQFAWASGIIGMAARLKPAANVMIGPFWAESMMFAETFARVGAYQVAGTARLYQLPFFAAVADYVLIGEEIFAADAYLTKDPIKIGSLFSQDVYKLVAIVLSVIGALLSTAGVTIIVDLLKK
ncbi:MAG TPA: hypothetical protein ENG61_03570 [Candidatus Korarchaeota archaeon]|nr:hypothetical protein [Candidatus Korarchaeota archaeon]